MHTKDFLQQVILTSGGTIKKIHMSSNEDK